MIEKHPFEPFLPANAKVLFLGSFPPQPKRWCMEFYYPNFINDFWRITGILFFSDKEYFIVTSEKKFDYNKIISFCSEKGIALFDTATAIIRQKDNASDKFLEVVEQTNLSILLKKIPDCKAVVTTGQKATDILVSQFGCKEPKTGEKVSLEYFDFYRMPSTSRAYPLSIEKKAELYKSMFKDLKML